MQNQKFEAQLQAVKERLDQARGTYMESMCGMSAFSWIRVAQKAASSSPLNFGRIAKPLRGGGGVAQGPVPITGGGGSSANPLSRLQGEESGYVHFMPSRL